MKSNGTVVQTCWIVSFRVCECDHVIFHHLPRLPIFLVPKFVHFQWKSRLDDNKENNRVWIANNCIRVNHQMCSLCGKVPCAVYAERCAPCSARRIKKIVALHVFQALSIRSAFVEMAKYWFAHGRRANVPTFNPIFICIIDYFKLILSRNSHHLFHFNTLFKVNTVWDWMEWNITRISNKHLNLFWIRGEVILDRVWNKFRFSSRCSIRFHLSVILDFSPLQRKIRQFAFSFAQREFHSEIKKTFSDKIPFLENKINDFPHFTHFYEVLVFLIHLPFFLSLDKK